MQNLLKCHALNWRTGRKLKNNSIDKLQHGCELRSYEYHMFLKANLQKIGKILFAIFSIINSFKRFVTSWKCILASRILKRSTGSCWSTHGRQSANSRPTVGRQTADSRPTGFLGRSSSQLPKICVIADDELLSKIICRCVSEFSFLWKGIDCQNAQISAAHYPIINEVDRYTLSA